MIAERTRKSNSHIIGYQKESKKIRWGLLRNAVQTRYGECGYIGQYTNED